MKMLIIEWGDPDERSFVGSSKSSKPPHYTATWSPGSSLNDALRNIYNDHVDWFLLGDIKFTKRDKNKEIIIL